MFYSHSKHGEQRNGKRSSTKDTKTTKREFDEFTNRRIGCASEVHQQLGPGLLESTYEPCLAHAPSRNGFCFQLQLTWPVQDIDL